MGTEPQEDRLKPVLLKGPATVGGRYKGERGPLKSGRYWEADRTIAEWRSEGNQSVQWVIQNMWLNFCGWRGSE